MQNSIEDCFRTAIHQKQVWLKPIELYFCFNHATKAAVQDNLGHYFEEIICYIKLCSGGIENKVHSTDFNEEWSYTLLQSRAVVYPVYKD